MPNLLHQLLIDDFIVKFESRITAQPESAPLCLEASDLGILVYRDYPDDEQYSQFVALLDAPIEPNSGVKKLLAITPPWGDNLDANS